MAANKLSYTFDDYINNPSGKGSAVKLGAINLSSIKEELVSLEKNGRTQVIVYYNSNKKQYLLHFKIPSKSTEGFYNDVVIELTEPKTGISMNDHTVRHYKVKFFSNDYNFVYTYAYAFKTHGILADGFEKKLPIACTNTKATTRNPDNTVGYSKSICMAYIIMNERGLFEITNLRQIAKSGTLYAVLSTIQTYSKREDERKKLEADRKQQANKESQEQNRRSNRSKLSRTSMSIRQINTITPKAKISGKSKITSSTKSKRNK